MLLLVSMEACVDFGDLRLSIGEEFLFLLLIMVGLAYGYLTCLVSDTDIRPPGGDALCGVQGACILLLKSSSDNCNMQIVVEEEPMASV